MKTDKSDKRRNPIIVFVYNSLKDPLFYGTGIAYFKRIHAIDSSYEFHVITFETSKYRLSGQELEIEISSLSSQNIFWYPLKWRVGFPSVFYKIFMAFEGFVFVILLKFRTKAKLIVSLANIAGAYAFIFSKILGLKNFEYTYEPHSEFMLEFGTWKRYSLSYQFLNKMERLVGVYGDYIATGTKYLQQRLSNQWKSKAKVLVVPSCVDESKFKFSETCRAKLRSEYNMEDKKVVLYLGKFGGLYYNQEIASFCRSLSELDPSLYFFIATPNETKKVEAIFLQEGMLPEKFVVTEAPFDRVNEYISAADIGIVGIPPYPAQRFRSPLKVGEYLMCGLPYVVCKGISEDDDWAINRNVGVVVNDFSNESAKKALPGIHAFLKEENPNLRRRAREAGIAYRGIEIAVNAFLSVFKEVYK